MIPVLVFDRLCLVFMQMAGKGKSSNNPSKGKTTAAKKTAAKKTNSGANSKRLTNNSANAAIDNNNRIPPVTTNNDEFSAITNRIAELEKQFDKNLSEQRTFFAQMKSLIANRDSTPAETSKRKRTQIVEDYDDTDSDRTSVTTTSKRNRIVNIGDASDDDLVTGSDQTIPSGEKFLSIFSSLPEETQNRVAAMAPASLASFSHVDLTTREKIWSQVFVDLARLSPRRGLYRDEFTLSLRSDGASSSPSIAMTPKNTVKISDIRHWETLFEIYSAVYISHPKLSHHAIPMLAYRKHIRDLANAHTDWRSYDETFRAMRVSENWGWDHVPTSLMNEATLRAIINLRNDRNNDNDSRSDSNSGSEKRRGVCHKFNDVGSCTFPNCKYRHMCRSCGEDHPELRCKADDNPQQNQPKGKRGDRR